MLVTLQASAQEMVTFQDNMDAYIVTKENYSIFGEIPYHELTYTSYDAKKNKVTLSARFYTQKKTIGHSTFDDGKIINNIFLACHPTVTDNWETPTGGDPIDKEVARLAGVQDETSIVLFPDYCGYGVSSHLQHPYLVSDVTARNCIDALMALFDEIKRRNWKVAENLETHILGYSQGGATALACTKYLESDACPDSVKNKVRLYETACGDGPYSPIATINQYLEWGKPTNSNGGDDLEYSCVLPLIVAAAKEAYADGCMRTVNVEDYFSDEFLSSGVLDLINSKGASTDVLARAIGSVMKRQRPVDVLSENIIDKEKGTLRTDTKEYKCLMRAMQLSDLTIGWEPKHPIYFYHLECDKVVPYVNTLEIFKAGHIGGNSKSGLCQYISPQEAHSEIKSIVESNKEELQNLDFNNISHAHGGIVFYADYMFGRDLREVWSRSSAGDYEYYKGIGRTR